VYIPEGGAVVVVNVLEDSPAMEGGLKTLDILLEIERRPIYKVGPPFPTHMVAQEKRKPAPFSVAGSELSLISLYI
jgi:C-terminal processing protease CtpA/Prc